MNPIHFQGNQFHYPVAPEHHPPMADSTIPSGAMQPPTNGMQVNPHQMKGKSQKYVTRKQRLMAKAIKSGSSSQMRYTEVDGKLVRFTESRYACDICHKVFMFAMNLLCHRLTHSNKQKTYTCFTCASFFLSKRKFEKHQGKHAVRCNSSQCQCN